MKKDLGAKAFVYPLPVLIIGSYGEDGTPDAMNAAWGGQCGPKHIALNLSAHQTTENIKQRKAFTVSFADLKNMIAADYVGLVSAKHDKDKLKKAGIHVVKSAHVDAPILDDFPLSLECKVIDIREELGHTRIVGEVVNMLAEENRLDAQGGIDGSKLEALSYDAETRSYRLLGDIVGNAFHDGEQLKK